MKKEILQDKVDALLATLNPDQRATAIAAIADMNEVVNEIESRMPTTQNHYGSYLSLATTKNAAVYLILAGANRNGVIAALKINTGDF